jgi:hypothetical protein
MAEALRKKPTPEAKGPDKKAIADAMKVAAKKPRRAPRSREQVIADKAKEGRQEVSKDELSGLDLPDAVVEELPMGAVEGESAKPKKERPKLRTQEEVEADPEVIKMKAEANAMHEKELLAEAKNNVDAAAGEVSEKPKAKKKVETWRKKGGLAAGGEAHLTSDFSGPEGEEAAIEELRIANPEAAAALEISNKKKKGELKAGEAKKMMDAATASVDNSPVLPASPDNGPELFFADGNPQQNIDELLEHIQALQEEKEQTSKWRFLKRGDLQKNIDQAMAQVEELQLQTGENAGRDLHLAEGGVAAGKGTDGILPGTQGGNNPVLRGRGTSPDVDVLAAHNPAAAEALKMHKEANAKKRAENQAKVDAGRATGAKPLETIPAEHALEADAPATISAPGSIEARNADDLKEAA